MVQVNGEIRELTEGESAEALLVRLGFVISRVAVELNKEIIPRKNLSQTTVRNGDILEVVSFVGGG